MRHLPTILLGACCAIASAFAAARETITLCYERQEVLPWRTLDNQGLNFDLLGEVARRTGVRFEYQSMPWKRCLAQLRDNQVGGAFAVSFNRERMELGAFPGGQKADAGKRMHVDRYVLVRRKGSTVEWDGRKLRNLDGRVGFQLGYSVGDFLREQGVAVDEGSQQADELIQKLLAGRVAAAALGGGDAVRLMRGPLASRIEVLPVPLVEKSYYLVLSQALVARDPDLAARIWNAVEQVRSSATYRRREQQLMGGRD